ncbi:MAG: glycosyltransferase family 4 protein [Betaproteobacteria bacterium]|nr:glycosyltransferase family 4 protein [Betaproteobacteria bacterium]
MRILYLHQYFTTPDMSGGTRSYEMARRLVEWGYEVHVVTSWRKATQHVDWFEENIDGIHVHWLPVPYDNAMDFWQRVKAFFRFALKAGQRATKLRGDIVFATSTPLTIALPGALAAWRLKVPIVFEVRDLWPDVPIAMGYLQNPIIRKAAQWLEGFAYARSARVVALSGGMADGVVRAGYPKERVAVIPNSSDLELFAHSEEGLGRFREAYPELGSGPVVLYPGTLGKANGVAYLAHLAHAVLPLRPDVRFVVFGEGAERGLIEETARSLGVLGKNFFLYTPLPKRELVDAFSAAAVVISLFIDEPALRANSANKFFDALASGTTVAINYQGWQKELLEETGAGIGLGPDPSAAAAPLLALLNAPQRLADCGSRARQLAEERFDRDKLARQLERVLLDAVGEYS